jgi:hypothetical protein
VDSIKESENAIERSLEEVLKSKAHIDKMPSSESKMSEGYG